MGFIVNLVINIVIYILMGSNPITLQEACVRIIDNLISLLSSNINLWILLFFGSLHWMCKQVGKRPQSYLDFYFSSNVFATPFTIVS